MIQVVKVNWNITQKVSKLISLGSISRLGTNNTKINESGWSNVRLMYKRKVKKLDKEKVSLERSMD